MTDSFAYPDTAIADPDPFFDRAHEVIASGKPVYTNLVRECYENQFSNPSSKVIVFLFDKKVGDSLTWDQIKKNYVILRRYELSLDDLKKIDFTIHYP